MKFGLKIFIFEIIAVFVFMLLWQYLAGFHALLSVFCGGLAWILPQFYFIWRSRVVLHPKNINNMLGSFFAHEAIKLIFSAILVILSVKFLKIMMLPFINGYIIAVFIGTFTSYQQVKKI